MKKKKGFTLIELLVVMGVIAILAAVILVNLRGARERAMDARVVSALGQVRAVAEIIQSRDASYVNICATATSLRTADTINGLHLLQEDMVANTPGIINPVACFGTVAAYCVSSRLNEAGTFWCVNSAGRSGRATSACLTINTGCAGVGF